MSTSRSAGRAEPTSIAWTLSRRLGMVIVLALAFSLSAIVTIYTLFRSGNTEVPNVVGKQETEAQRLAEQAGLRVKIQRRNDPSVAVNSVIETRPGPKSSVKKDSVLTIVVSAGPVQTKSESQPGDPAPHGRRIRTRNFVVGVAKSFVDSFKTVTE